MPGVISSTIQKGEASMIDSIRTIKAFSESQTTALRYFQSLDDIEEWLSSLTDSHDTQEDSYYLHIDQLQILPPTEKGIYPVFTIYHRVYLKRGE